MGFEKNITKEHTEYTERKMSTLCQKNVCKQNYVVKCNMLFCALFLISENSVAKFYKSF